MTYLLRDVSTMTVRGLRLVSRDLDAMITAVLLPVIILLMFVLVFGGAVDIGTDYINYVTPGVILLAAGFGAASTALAAASVDGARVRVPTDGSVAHVRTVLSAVETAGVVPEHWEVRAPTLDDVFLTLTGHVGQDRTARPAEVAA